MGSLKNLAALIMMIAAVVFSGREIYQDYFQDDEYVSDGILIDIKADTIYGTDQFLYGVHNYVFCLDWEGNCIWKSPELGSGDIVFLGDAFFARTWNRVSETGGVAFLTCEGEILWQKEVGKISDKGIGASHDLLVVGTRTGVLWAFSKKGDVLWKYYHHAIIEQVLVAPDSSCIIFTDYDQAIHCVRDGNCVWSKNAQIISVPLGNQTVAFSPDSSYIVYGSKKDGFKIVGCTPEGEELWSSSVKSVPQSIAITDDSIIVGCKEYGYKFSSAGTLLWEIEVGEENLYLAVTPESDYIVFGSNHPYRLIVLNGDGITLWKAKSGNFIRAVFISPDGKYVTFSNNDGDLLIFSNPPESNSQ